MDVPALVARLRAIAADCFDLRAVERLRNLADDIEARTGPPPIIQIGDGEGNRTSDD